MTPCSTRMWIGATAFMLFIASWRVDAAPPEFEVELRNHLFEPDVVRIPSDRKVRLVIINRDRTPEEFKSLALNREKIVMGSSTVTIFVGPLPPGEYSFVGEFNPNTALGRIVVEKDDDAR